MRKRFVIIAAVVVLIFAMTLPVFSAAPGRGRNINGCGICIGLSVDREYCILRDENGDFFDRDTFEANLDKAIEDGLIKAEDKEYYLEMYDDCITNGSTFNGLGRGRRNGGNGAGRGRNYFAP